MKVLCDNVEVRSQFIVESEKESKVVKVDQLVKEFIWKNQNDKIKCKLITAEGVIVPVELKYADSFRYTTTANPDKAVTACVYMYGVNLPKTKYLHVEMPISEFPETAKLTIMHH